MFRWRLLLGVGLIGLLVVLAWADHRCPVPGAVLLPLAGGLSLLATGEFLALARQAVAGCAAWPVYVGNMGILLAAWIPAVQALNQQGGDSSGGLGLAALGVAERGMLLILAGALLLAMLEEIRRFAGPGGVTARLGVASLGLLYGGLLLSFLVLLRMGYGIGALASVILVVKMADTGAYFVGHLLGRHQLAPRLSPGKTVEGTIGGLLVGWAAAWAVFTWLTPALKVSTPPAHPGAVSISPGLTGEGRLLEEVPPPVHSPEAPWWAWTAYGLVLSLVGLGGDLAESLLKRDAGCKDSSRWMPGFGGVLDLLDSLLWAAPVAYFWWAVGWIR